MDITACPWLQATAFRRIPWPAMPFPTILASWAIEVQRRYVPTRGRRPRSACV